MASVYTITTGETLNTHESFKSHLPWGSYKNVPNSKDCDVILAFCPVKSRVGTDVEAALRVIPEGKPLALVVLHHTFDSNYTLPDTKRFMKRPDSITVDCLFTDDGLMRCPCNDDAVRAVAKFLQQHGKHSPYGKLALGKLALGLLILILLYMSVSTFFNQAVELINTKKELELMLQNCKELEGKLSKNNITINTLKEEVENYKELDREAKKEMNSFKEQVENYMALERKANREKNSLQEEVENCKSSQRKANEEINSLQEEVENYKVLLWKANKKNNYLEEEVKKYTQISPFDNEVFSGLRDTEKQDDKSAQLPSESSQNLEMKASHDTTVVGDNEMDEKDKQPDNKEAIELIVKWFMLLIILLCLYAIYFLCINT